MLQYVLVQAIYIYIHNIYIHTYIYIYVCVCTTPCYVIPLRPKYDMIYLLAAIG